MISLRCEDCLGTMEVDENREVLTCPYCGSKKMIPISDAVKIEKIKQEAEIEKRKMDYDEDRKTYIRVILLFLGIVAVSAFVFLFLFPRAFSF